MARPLTKLTQRLSNRLILEDADPCGRVDLPTGLNPHCSASLSYWVRLRCRAANRVDLPILYPERYFLTLNRTAARQIGLKFPEQLLARADRVID